MPRDAPATAVLRHRTVLRPVWIGLVGVLLAVGLGPISCRPRQAASTESDMSSSSTSSGREIINLPEPRTEGELSLEEALRRRESVREYLDEPLTLEAISQLLWSAQGITRGWGGRTAPSAGATYPMEIYVLTADGVFHYRPRGHRVERLSDRDLRRELAVVGLRQSAIEEAPAVFALAAVVARTAGRYGARADRYVLMEAGHVGQNILLQAEALGLGAVPIGAFREEEAERLLGLPPNQDLLYLIPVGHPR